MIQQVLQRRKPPQSFTLSLQYTVGSGAWLTDHAAFGLLPPCWACQHYFEKATELKEHEVKKAKQKAPVSRRLLFSLN
jgi:hypothetical protein